MVDENRLDREMETREKKTRKPGESKYQADIRRRREERKATKETEETTEEVAEELKTEEVTTSEVETPKQTFKQAFAAARKAGKKTFMWTNPKTKKEGEYTTELKK